MRERVVIIGGNAAGMSAAGRARRLNPDLEIEILEAGRFISYGICGVPWYIAGKIPDYSQLIHFTPEKLWEERKIKCRTRVRAEEILAGRRRVRCTDLSNNETLEVEFDRLVIATGYVPRIPPIEGVRSGNVFTVSRIEDSQRLAQAIQSNSPRRAAVVGGGYVGLVMAAALRERGIEVTLLERGLQLQPSLDQDMASVVAEQLESHGVKILLGVEVRELTVDPEGTVNGVRLGRDVLPCDLALIDVGVQPSVEMARRSGLRIGSSGAIWVDQRGQTDFLGIYAAGNCAETTHLVSNQPLFSALATSASRQGRVVGENLAGVRSVFRGTLETSMLEIFGLGIGRTGLTLREALEERFQADAVQITADDRASYLPCSRKMHVRLVFQKPSGKLLGGQIVGQGSAAKRIDTLATALEAKMKLDDLAELNLGYSPSLGTVWDPLQIAANVGLRKLSR